MGDPRRLSEIPDLAALTPADWTGFDRVIDALALRTGYGDIVVTVSGGRATDLRCGSRVHLAAAENPSAAVQRLLRGSSS